MRQFSLDLPPADDAPHPADAAHDARTGGSETRPDRPRPLAQLDADGSTVRRGATPLSVRD